MDGNNEMTPDANGVSAEDEQKMPADQSTASIVENGNAIVDAKPPPAEEESKPEATVIDVEQPALEDLEDATPAPIEVEQEYHTEGEAAPIEIEQEYYNEEEAALIDVEQEYYNGGEESEMDAKPVAVAYEQEEYADEGGDYYVEDSKPADVTYGEETTDGGYVEEVTYDDEMDSKPAAVPDEQVYANHENAPIDVEQEYYDEGEYYEEDSKPAAVNYYENDDAEEYEEDLEPEAVNYDQEHAGEGDYYQEDQEDDYVDKGEYFEEVTKSLANDAGFIYVALPDGTRAKVSVDNLVPVQDASAEDYAHQADAVAPEDELLEEQFHDEPAEEDYLVEQQSEEVYMEQNEDGVLGGPAYDTPIDLMGIIPEDESKAFSVEGSAQPNLKDPPLPPFPDMAEGAEDEETGQSAEHPPPGNSIEVPMGPTSDTKMPMTTNSQNGDGEEQPQKKKREINPDFKDLQSTGKWGTISKTEMIVAGVVSVLIIIGVIVAVAVVLTRDDTSEKDVPADTQAPTPAPTPIPADQRFSVLMDALNGNNVTMSIADSRYSDNLSNYEGLIGPDGGCESRPHDCAMSWALFEDNFPPSNNNISDRFAMATLFYSLGGNEWKNNTNWLSAESYCDWYGIECNRGASFNEDFAYIEGLDLNDNNLIGGIPLELSLVYTMITVALKDNTITGELPGAVFGGMQELFVLRLQNNRITGTIPDNLRDSNSLGTYKALCCVCNLLNIQPVLHLSRV